MRSARHSAPLLRYTSLLVCFALLLTTVSLVGINPVLAKKPIIIRQNNQQSNRAAKKVAPVPPQPGAPQAGLPNLDEARQRRAEPLRVPESVPSTLRSRHKPLESRQGRRVGDLPPRRAAGTRDFDNSSERMANAGVRRGETTVRSHHARRSGLISFLPTPMPQGGSSENVIWTNMVGVSAAGNSLTKTAANGWGNAGAVSTQTLVSGDGYLEFTVTELNTYRTIGLSNGDSSQDWTDVDFAMMTNCDDPGNLKVRITEAGVVRGDFGTFTTGDKLRVAVEGGVVKYRKNGTLLYTSTIAPTYPLLVDTALYSNGSTISNAVMSGNLSNLQNVTWTNVVGVSAAGNSLTKTAANGWGNAGAVSTQTLVSGDGYLEFTVTELNTYRTIGLSNGDGSQDWTDIDFAMMTNCDDPGNLKVRITEAGVVRGDFGTFATGDKLRVAVEGGVVKYRKNGTLLYTSTIAPTYPLLVDTALYSNGSTISNVVISGPNAGSATSTSDQFVQNFLQWGLGRAPNNSESSYWTDILRSAYPKGQTSMLMAMTEFGMTVFESAEYGARNRSNHDYVYDLYKTYLLRDPDTEGWNFWTDRCNTYGREAVRQGFEESAEFQGIEANLAATGAASSNAASLATAQVNPFNQSGNQIEARDCEWSVPLISLPGRGGLDFGLSLSYSSLAWTRSGPYVYFDQDNESLSPGFTIGFPTVQFRKFDAQTGRNVYVLTAAGRHVELRQVGTSNVYEAGDSSYLQLIDNGGSLLVRATDGTQMSYARFLTGWSLTQIEDRNGNIITVNNDWRGDMQTITDTLGRVVTFNYDNNANLISITQSWAGQSHTWATFGWGTVTMQPSSSSQVVGISSGEVIPALTQVGLDDGSRYNFEYTGAGQVNLIRRYTSDNVQRSYTAYDYQGTSDCPRIYQARVWAENWSDINYVAHEVITQFSDNGDGSHQTTAPDGTTYKEFYGGTGSSPLWQRGLVTSTQILTGTTVQKTTSTAYTQENTSVSYQTNPRVIETNVSDGSNHRRTTIDYSVAAYAQYGLPYFVSEYAANGTTEIRRTYTDYNLNQAYLDRRIIGLVSARQLYDPVAGQWQAKTTYGYDDPARLSTQATTAPGHDQSFDNTFTARGNLTAAARWDVTDINNSSKALTNYVSYDAAGNVLSATDAAGHTTSIGYADSFSDGNNGRGTFSYPTVIKDADWNASTAPNNYSTIQYNFDFGAKTRVQGPPPQNQANGIVQTFTYDAAARLQQVTTANTGAYIRYVYGANYRQSYSSVNNVADDSYAIEVFDGAGRTFASASYHPGSAGGYAAVYSLYDVMGRVAKQSNPAEITGGWLPTGDDASGWIFTQQSYDWKGRPLVTTNTDGTPKYASYAGCGCAGGEVVTLADEVGRQQKVYSDVLGRQWKTEVLNWDGTVYATTVKVLNARDQVRVANQYSGAASSDASSTNAEASCPDGSCQKATMSYDGYGRLQSKHAPEQNSGTATVYTYNSDDTIQSVTDARGANASYIYNNNRHLVNEIDYTAPAGITPTANVAFAYDTVGNRTSMTDGLGTKSYSYNQLSQMTSETRTFTSVGAFTLSYDYNLAGELKKITDATNMTINYGYDSNGRVSSVTGADSLYAGVSNYASNLQYRAWGGMKSMTDGKGYVSSLGYNAKLQPASFQISGNLVSQSYDYYDDGRISVVHNTSDANFDRSYSYDHAGRLTEAKSGALVNGIQYGGIPYHETFGYDAFSNLNGRASDSWGDFSDTDTASYSNNRRAGWGYDADGRNTSIDTRTNAYDAVGLQASMTGQQLAFNGSYVSISQAFNYDADGAMAKEVSTQAGSSTNTYYLRSSVLGNAIVEELDGSGAKNVGYVYSPDGAELANQSSGIVNWKHKTPAGTAQYTVNSYNSATTRTELDPLGADVSLNAPSSAPPNEGDGDIGAGHLGGIMDARWSDMFNLSSGCTVNGSSTTCSDAIAWQNSAAYAGEAVRVLYSSTGTINGKAVFSQWTGSAWVAASSMPFSITHDTHTFPLTSELIAQNTDASGRWVPGNGSVLLGSGQLGAHAWFVTVRPDDSEFYESDSSNGGAGNTFRDAVEHTFDRVQKILEGKSKCAEFFGPHALEALAAMRKKVQTPIPSPNGPGGTYTGIAQYYPEGVNTIPNGPYRTPGSFTVYTDGPFFMQGKGMIAGYPPGRPQAQIAAILHELAHNIKNSAGNDFLIKNDGPGTPEGQSEKNTAIIKTICGKEIFDGH